MILKHLLVLALATLSGFVGLFQLAVLGGVALAGDLGLGAALLTPFYAAAALFAYAAARLAPGAWVVCPAIFALTAFAMVLASGFDPPWLVLAALNFAVPLVAANGGRRRAAAPDGREPAAPIPEPPEGDAP